jgi:hypothetical protein
MAGWESGEVWLSRSLLGSHVSADLLRKILLHTSPTVVRAQGFSILYTPKGSLTLLSPWLKRGVR